MNIEKVVNALPETLKANTIYVVRATLGFDLHITDNTASVAYTLNGLNKIEIGNSVYSYSDGRLVRKDSPDGSYKTFKYEDGLLVQVDHVTGTHTIRTVLTRTDGKLTGKTVSIV